MNQSPRYRFPADGSGIPQRMEMKKRLNRSIAGYNPAPDQDAARRFHHPNPRINAVIQAAAR